MLKRSCGPTRKPRQFCCPFLSSPLSFGYTTDYSHRALLHDAELLFVVLLPYTSRTDAALHLHLGHDLVGPLDNLQKDIEERLDIEVFQYEALYALLRRFQI